MSHELLAFPNHQFRVNDLIPLTLMSNLLNKGHRLFVDNFYTTPGMVAFLLENDTCLVGTVRFNRKNFPSDLAAADTARGESIFAVSDGVLAVKYRAVQDKSNKKPKVVYMLSTDHANMVAAAPKKDKDGNTVLKPTCVLDYNRCMGGVDLNDQQLESILAIRKSYKWHKKLFFRFMLQCLLSAHKLYKIYGGTNE